MASKKNRKKIKKEKVLRKKKNILLFKPKKLKIRIIGVGGGAASILSEMAVGLKGTNFILADTDQRSFKGVSSRIKKFQFGEELTRGWGTGMNNEIAEKAAIAVKEKIRNLVKDSDLVILISCLGGGVGSGSSIVFSEILKEEKILSLGIFTLPFDFEGEKKMRLAKNSLKKIRNNLSGLVVLPNEEMLEQSDKKLSLKKSLSLTNQVLINYLKDLMGIISCPGLINIDFADLRSILKGKGQMICFGSGTGQGPGRVEESIKGIFENPFFICPKKIKKILFNISNGYDLGLKEVEEAAQAVFRLNPRAKIIFGVSQNQKMAKRIKISFLGVGENTPEKEIFMGTELTAEKKSSDKEKKKNQNKGINKKNGEKGKAKKRKPRLSAIEVKEAEKEEEEKEWLGDGDNWEIPAFLRKNIK